MHRPLAHRRHLSGVLQAYPVPVGIATVFAVVGVIFVVVCFGNPPSKEGPEAGFGVIAFAGLFPVGLALLLRYRPTDAEALEAGIAWRTSGKGHFRPWSEVYKVFRVDFIGGNATGEIKVWFSDGSCVAFDQTLIDYERLATEIQTCAAEAMMPAVLAKVKNQPIEFGPITIQSDGVVVANAFSPWEEVRCYFLIAGYFVIVVAGPRRDRHESAMLREIPNYLVLMNLLPHYGISFQAPPDPG